jgi:hypothetical protein
MALAQQALYSHRVAEMHEARRCLAGINSEPTNVTDYTGIWERAGKRIEAIDPDGREAYAVLRYLQATRSG